MQGGQGSAKSWIHLTASRNASTKHASASSPRPFAKAAGVQSALRSIDNFFMTCFPFPLKHHCAKDLSQSLSTGFELISGCFVVCLWLLFFVSACICGSMFRFSSPAHFRVRLSSFLAHARFIFSCPVHSRFLCLLLGNCRVFFLLPTHFQLFFFVHLRSISTPFSFISGPFRA